MSEDQNAAAPAKPPVTVEIRIDGRVHHRFVAARVTTSEDAELLTLNAARWQPSAVQWPENSALPVPSVEVNGQPVPPAGFGVRIGIDVLGALSGEFLGGPHDPLDGMPLGQLYAIPDGVSHHYLTTDQEDTER